MSASGNSSQSQNNGNEVEGGGGGPGIDVSLLEKRLEGLRDTQESVQGLSLWCQTNKKHSTAIIDTWLRVLRKSPVEKRLTMFYLANDVVQHAKRKSDMPVVNQWAFAVQKATPLVRSPSSVSSAISRIFKIWEERNVYSKDAVADLLSLLNNVSAKEKVEKKNPETWTASADKVAAFQPSAFAQKVKQAFRLKSHLGVTFRTKHYVQMDIEKLKTTIKNREQGEEIIGDLASLLEQLRASETKLQNEVDQRRQIVEHGEIAIVYYENVRGEARVVNSAYKNFTNRVVNTKAKVDEKIKAFDEMEGDIIEHSPPRPFSSQDSNTNEDIKLMPPPPMPPRFTSTDNNQTVNAIERIETTHSTHSNFPIITIDDTDSNNLGIGIGVVGHLSSKIQDEKNNVVESFQNNLQSFLQSQQNFENWSNQNTYKSHIQTSPQHQAIYQTPDQLPFQHQPQPPSTSPYQPPPPLPSGYPQPHPQPPPIIPSNFSLTPSMQLQMHQQMQGYHHQAPNPYNQEQNYSMPNLNDVSSIPLPPGNTIKNEEIHQTPPPPFPPNNREYEDQGQQSDFQQQQQQIHLEDDSQQQQQQHQHQDYSHLSQQQQQQQHGFDYTSPQLQGFSYPNNNSNNTNVMMDTQIRNRHPSPIRQNRPPRFHGNNQRQRFNSPRNPRPIIPGHSPHRERFPSNSGFNQSNLESPPPPHKKPLLSSEGQINNNDNPFGNIFQQEYDEHFGAGNEGMNGNDESSDYNNAEKFEGFSPQSHSQSQPPPLMTSPHGFGGHRMPRPPRGRGNVPRGNFRGGRGFSGPRTRGGGGGGPMRGRGHF